MSAAVLPAAGAGTSSTASRCAADIGPFTTVVSPRCQGALESSGRAATKKRCVRGKPCGKKVTATVQGGLEGCCEQTILGGIGDRGVFTSPPVDVMRVLVGHTL